MRRALLIPLVLLTLLGVVGPARAQTGGPIGAPVTFSPKPDTTLTLEGKGPFRGSIEVRREGGALTIVNELDLDHYVMGVREVPGSWPMEALKAQAVAARTYVLWEIEKGYWKRFGFNVCGTTSCQVYEGATAELGERGRRWSAAVKATANQVLLDGDGRPALTRYHSSSGGRTLANEVVYPSDGPRPYLRAVDDPYDRVSPLHTWKVSFKRDDLQRILHDAIGLAGELVDVTVDQGARTMKLTTKGGSLEMTTVRFRRELSETAPKVFPDLYPALRSDGERMPFTMPSSRFSIEKRPDGFVVHGRGYGHGVGMSQYGALGRARDGQSYDEILSAYYAGLHPTVWTGQRLIRVAVVRSVPSARITGNGAFGVSAGSQALASSTLGGWGTMSSGVRSILVLPPQGHSLPLALTGVRTPEGLVVDPPKSGVDLEIGFVVPKPAQVTGVLTLEGKEIVRRKMVVEAGERTLRMPLVPGDLARKATYDLKLTAFDGTRTVDHAATVVLTKPSRHLVRNGFLVVPVLAAIGLWRRRVVVQRARRQRQASAR
jgi:stage II sporulation protein D